MRRVTRPILGVACRLTGGFGDTRTLSRLRLANRGVFAPTGPCAAYGTLGGAASRIAPPDVLADLIVFPEGKRAVCPNGLGQTTRRIPVWSGPSAFSGGLCSWIRRDLT